MIRIPEDSRLRFRPSHATVAIPAALIGAGLLLILLQFLFPWESAGGGVSGSGNPRLWFSLHLTLISFLPVGLAAIFFPLLHAITGSVWSVTVRRIFESFSWFLPFLLILLLLILLGGPEILYADWWLQAPQGWAIEQWRFNRTFFILRNLFILLAWTFLGLRIWKKSVKADRSASESSTGVPRAPAAGLIFLALGFAVISWDLIASLDPLWNSSIWAFYIFAGAMPVFFAVALLWIPALKRAGYYGESVNENHLHDLGGYLWGSSIFWFYIAFSQYLLIWYAGLPEEISFYQIRTSTGWMALAVMVPLFRFVLPFFLLITEEAKRNSRRLAITAVVALLGHILECYWLVYPHLDRGRFVAPGRHDAGPLLLGAGIFILATGLALSRGSLIPIRDPDLQRSVAFRR